MKALLCKQHGLPDTLVYEDVEDPTPGEGEVIIDMRAAGVNFPDVLIIQNLYQFKPDLPFTPGSDLAGIVKEVGEGVTHLKVGQEVFGFVAHGALAEEVIVPANGIVQRIWG